MTTKKPQRNRRETTKKPQRNCKETAKKPQRNFKETTKNTIKTQSRKQQKGHTYEAFD